MDIASSPNAKKVVKTLLLSLALEFGMPVQSYSISSHSFGEWGPSSFTSPGGYADMLASGG